MATIKILFLCTAHNSLSQRLYLDLTASGHDVSIEYAISDKVMLEAVDLFKPNIIICPFLTTRVPAKIYNETMTLIVHPGPPGDAGPSSIDWLLMGDDGSIADSSEMLKALDKGPIRPCRTHWGVTVLQATEAFDAGPVWAWEQFLAPYPAMTKSDVYRGPITRAAAIAVPCAISRITAAIEAACEFGGTFASLPTLKLDPTFASLSVTIQLPFRGGKTHERPLLKAAQRAFDPSKQTAMHISRRIRSADSQPGVLTDIFGPQYYLYGGQIETLDQRTMILGIGRLLASKTIVLGTSSGGVCIKASDGHGVWITHLRRPKALEDKAIWPKVPALPCRIRDGVMSDGEIFMMSYHRFGHAGLRHAAYIQLTGPKTCRVAYLYFDFYNGAMSTADCSGLIDRMDQIMNTSSKLESPVRAVVLMGGAYFSNGIALNVIEAANDPAMETWNNIKRIDDVVYRLLHTFPAHKIITVAALRGSAAAGGVALAAACDVVIAGSGVVLNPSYRAIGLHGSEYHTITYPGRCGQDKATEILRAMMPMSPSEAQRIGLVDYVFSSHGAELDKDIKGHVSLLLQSPLQQGLWKAKVDLSEASLARTRIAELAEMAKDCSSARSVRYHSRRSDFVRKVRPTQTPLRFAKHRRLGPDHLDKEEKDAFDDVNTYRFPSAGQLGSKTAGAAEEAVSASQQSPKHAFASAESSAEALSLLNMTEDTPKKQENKEPLWNCYYDTSQDTTER